MIVYPDGTSTEGFPEGSIADYRNNDYCMMCFCRLATKGIE